MFNYKSKLFKKRRNKKTVIYKRKSKNRNIR